MKKPFKSKTQIKNLYRTDQDKLHALRQIRKYLTLDKPKLLLRASSKVLVPGIPSLCGHTSDTEGLHITWGGDQYFPFHPLDLQFIVITLHFRGPLIWNKLPNLFSFLYFCLSHEDTNHLTLYCSQMTGCYMICKNAENVEHLGYWLRLCRFLCHCVCHLCEYFLIFVSWFLLAISYVFTPTLNKVIIT